MGYIPFENKMWFCDLQESWRGSLIGDVRNPAKRFTGQGMSEVEDVAACPTWDGFFSCL